MTNPSHQPTASEAPAKSKPAMSVAPQNSTDDEIHLRVPIMIAVAKFPGFITHKATLVGLPKIDPKVASGSRSGECRLA
jgi:hypothetical protein